MKKTTIISTVAALFIGATAFAQGGNTGNSSLPGEFLGWDGTGTNQPLEIRNDFNQPISLHTNGTERMNPYAVLSRYSSPPITATLAH